MIDSTIIDEGENYRSELATLRAELARVKKERDEAAALERERIAKFIDSLPGFAIHDHLSDVARRILANELGDG